MRFEDIKRKAELAANATGETFIIGVRPFGRGWFVHCDGVEVDGSPEHSVDDIIEELKRQYSAHLSDFRMRAGNIENTLKSLES